MRPPKRIHGKPIWTPQDAADALEAAHEQPCEVGVPDQGTTVVGKAEMDALLARAQELAAATMYWRRQQYAVVFERHAYQGGWTKGVVKCRCSWRHNLDASQDNRALATQAITLWAQHLAEVVVR